MKNLNELYQLVYKQYKKDGAFICNSMQILLKYNDITNDEYKMVMAHFKSQKPTKELNKEFITPLYLNGYEDGAWWKFLGCSVKGSAIRRKFLRKMIQITK